MSDVTHRDVDRGWAWVVLVCAALNNVIQDAFTVSVAIFQVEFLECFSGSHGLVALVGAAFLSIQVLLGPVAGVVTDMLSHRLTIMAGGAIMSVGLLLSSFSPDLHVLLLLFGFVTGIGSGLCFTPSLTVTSAYFRKYSTLAYGIVLAAPGVGMLLGPYLLHWLIDAYGWRYAMAMFACVVAQICVFGAMFFPHNSQGHKQPSREDHALKTLQIVQDADTRIARGDRQQIETDVMTRSRRDSEAKSGSSSDREDRRSRSSLEVKLGSQIYSKVKRWSTSFMENKIWSLSSLGVEVTRSELWAMMGSKMTLCEHGSVLFSDMPLDAGGLSAESDSLTFPERLKGLLCRQFMWVMFLNQFLLWSGQAINAIFYVAYVQSVGVPDKHVPRLYTAYGLAIIVSRLVGGFLFSFIPNHLLHTAFCCQAAFAMVMGLLPVYGVTLPALFVGAVLAGATFGLSFLLVTPTLLRYVGLTDVSVAFGLIMMAGGVAIIVSPSLAGMAYDAFCTYSIAYYISGSSAAAAALSLLLLLFVRDLEPPGDRVIGKTRQSLAH